MNVRECYLSVMRFYLQIRKDNTMYYRNEENIMKTSSLDNNHALDLFAHYSDLQFREGKTVTVYGIPSGLYGHHDLDYNYSDRLWMANYTHAQEASFVATELGATLNSPRWLTIWLTYYYGYRVELVHILKGVNMSNGYHYNIFGTRKVGE